MSVYPAAGSTPRPSARPSVHCFRVAAAAHPGLLPRALDLFAKRGLVPDRCRADRHAAHRADAADRLTIEVWVAGLDDGPADHVAACLRRLVGVDSVMAWRGGELSPGDSGSNCAPPSSMSTARPSAARDSSRRS